MAAVDWHSLRTDRSRAVHGISDFRLRFQDWSYCLCSFFFHSIAVELISLLAKGFSEVISEYRCLPTQPGLELIIL